jgi:D-serine deaminase-like pyridoxal phosphate-dependent protein
VTASHVANPARSTYDAATRDLDPPLAIVDLEAFDANADDLVRRAAGRPVRVASKSVRCRALLERVLARPGFAGLLCYAAAEAIWLAEQGTSSDIVVAYPTVDHGALRALAGSELARSRVTLMIDSPDQLDVIDCALGVEHPEIRVCLEFDASWRPLPGLHIGARRSPVFTPRQAAALAGEITARAGFRLVGVMGYEAQIAGIADAGRRPCPALIRWVQQRSAAELARRRAEVVAAVRAVTDLEFVNGGGTGSLETTTREAAVTEVAAGSGLLAPSLFTRYSRFAPRPAALFALPVVRKPAPRIATVFAGGYVASGQAGPARLPSPWLPGGLRLLRLEGAGEVQTPVTGVNAASLRVGDRVWFRHAKAGELAEHYPEYHLVAGDRLERTVPTYRGEGKAFG